MLKRVIVFFTIFISNCYAGATIKEFASDGCSGFPDGTFVQQNVWLECCLEHDKAYWMGGEYRERLEADKKLKECVKKVGKPIVAQMMLLGVRAGGTPYLPTKFRWGYGWPYMRGYKAISENEKEMIRKSFNNKID
jgi:hypothetical protein